MAEEVPQYYIASQSLYVIVSFSKSIVEIFWLNPQHSALALQSQIVFQNLNSKLPQSPSTLLLCLLEIDDSM